MTDQSNSPPVEKRRWVGYAARGVGLLILGCIGIVFIAQRMSDGPLIEMIPGGPLRAGTLVPKDVSLAAILGDRGACPHGVCTAMAPIEFQLVDPPTSRYTGVMVYDGQVYIPCDLGFMWGRFEGRTRTVLHLIYLFKHWHEDALRDGRAVVRIDGQRYEGQAVRVTDPDLVAALRAQIEEMGRQWVAPKPLSPAPTAGPNDIWFFRIDPRTT